MNLEEIMLSVHCYDLDYNYQVTVCHYKRFNIANISKNILMELNF